MNCLDKFKRVVSFSIASFLMLQLFGCASPAHENSWYSAYNSETILVNVYSPDTYGLDGYVVDAAGLAVQIKELTRTAGLKYMVIDAKQGASLFDQAVAVYIGEINGLKTYSNGLLTWSEISTEELLAELDSSTSDDSFTVFLNMFYEN